MLAAQIIHEILADLLLATGIVAIMWTCIRHKPKRPPTAAPPICPIRFDDDEA